MAESVRTIAVLVANPALGSILGMVLAASPTLRVRPFDSALALLTYMRLAPVDLLVTDFDSESARADQVANALRAAAGLERRDFQIIALASKVTAETKSLSIAAGIDEVIVKPMSPKYLLERVLSRLARRAALVGTTRRVQPAPKRPDFPQYGNVIPLFGRHVQPQH